MPEGDTVWHTAALLREALVGKTLTRCDIRVPRYATVDLTGQVVDAVISRGKHLFIRVGSASIHSHLKMDGSWRVNPVGPSRAGHRVRIVLQAGSGADAVRAAGIDLGVMEVLDRAHDGDVVAHLGPDLLGDDWDPHAAAANLAADPDRPLAEALLDQRVMAGVGNVYCNELCFISGHRPTAPVRSVSDPLRMVQRARDMLWLNRSRWNRSTTGDTRKGRELWVYGRAGRPCHRCGTLIESDRSGERISYWCPTCQSDAGQAARRVLESPRSRSDCT
jgi:endonuclease-8